MYRSVDLPHVFGLTIIDTHNVLPAQVSYAGYMACQLNQLPALQAWEELVFLTLRIRVYLFVI
jgi:hypothetical protein